MIDAAKWLDHAFALAQPPARGAPKQVDLRRSVSAAYYALFHRILALTADDLVGATHSKSSAYALVYRAFQHNLMEARCSECAKETMPARTRQAIGLASFSPEIKEAAAAFVSLQSARHRADYDPRGKVTLSDASDSCQTARQAMRALANAPPGELKLFLLYLLFGAR
ncbi:hypothetical protein [Sphingopyxis sp.]|uniref:hypothetical protein n=1 Tax=Sphingopyxis sp. TaxID=1908224 RepID=UPI0035AF0E08